VIALTEEVLVALIEGVLEGYRGLGTTPISEVTSSGTTAAS
jgi:hypothetical protein